MCHPARADKIAKMGSDITTVVSIKHNCKRHAGTFDRGIPFRSLFEEKGKGPFLVSDWEVGSREVPGLIPGSSKFSMKT